MLEFQEGRGVAVRGTGRIDRGEFRAVSKSWRPRPDPGRSSDTVEENEEQEQFVICNWRFVICDFALLFNHKSQITNLSSLSPTLQSHRAVRASGLRKSDLRPRCEPASWDRRRYRRALRVCREDQTDRAIRSRKVSAWRTCAGIHNQRQGVRFGLRPKGRAARAR